VRLDSGLPAHAEAGYLRSVGGGRVELALAHPTGLAELAEGTVEPVPAGRGLRIVLASVAVTGTSTAKDVATVARTIVVEGDTLRYELAMGAVGQPHQHHLAAELHRTG
jgi:hypothetical protein